MGKCSKCGRITPGTFSVCYSCHEKKKTKSFVSFGRRKCKKCGTVISGDRPYCFPCYQKFLNKN